MDRTHPFEVIVKRILENHRPLYAANLGIDVAASKAKKRLIERIPVIRIGTVAEHDRIDEFR